MIKLLTVALLTVFLTACNPSSFVTATISNKDYMAMTPEARAAYLAAVDEEYKTVSVKQVVEYLAGRPVPVGDDKTGFTAQWDRRARLVHLFPGHQPDGMGVETFVAMSFSTDENGDPLRNADGTIMKPVFVNAATQENFARAVFKGLLTTVPAAAVNGSLAALIASHAECKGPNCGGTGVTVINDNQNLSRSEALAGSSANAGAAASIKQAPACGSGGSCN